VGVDFVGNAGPYQVHDPAIFLGGDKPQRPVGVAVHVHRKAVWVGVGPARLGVRLVGTDRGAMLRLGASSTSVDTLVLIYVLYIRIQFLPAIAADRQVANTALPGTRRPMTVEAAMQLPV